MADNANGGRPGPPPNAHLWSRDGFNGDMCVTARPYPIVEYTRVQGRHVPHRLDIHDLDLPDRSDPEALPTVFAASRKDVSLAASARSTPTPFAWRNAESDELHFVQDGELDYVTDFGTLRAEPGDFVCLPRAVTYRVVPVTTPTLRVIVETPEQLRLDPPAPFGMISFGRDVKYPDPALSSDASGPTELLVKAFDGITRFSLPHDPLALLGIVGGQVPVWKLNLADIQPLTYVPHGGPPGSFAASTSRDLLFYTLSARPGTRPPMHHNADYDELIFYFRGPGAYGALDQPGQLAWTPKSVGHWGPPEDVPEGYLAWLIESTGTFRLTPVGHAAAHLMETGQFGRQPESADAEQAPVSA
ncbi:homogentisate 1,2-dioxygenase [Streptomyces sp. NPDC096311]|uniref:homogentisate 1,2-dioxygenase n=1 Tax=Streptomyces sp. NPDC096311 TaxID=3366083 RepID=UPI00382B6D2F